VSTFLVKLACELPDSVGRSLSLWTCAELARTLIRDGIVESISPQTVQRMLKSWRLKPWRVHYWLNSKVPRDEAFREIVLDLCDLYTRRLVSSERIVSVDECTSIQPRTRSKDTKPAQPDLVPQRLEHEYERKGALSLFAAFDIQTGEVMTILRQRKRQVEFIELLEWIDYNTPESVERIHVVADNASIHAGKITQQWIENHPRFQMHNTPTHCSWMNQVEQWFSILRRKRLSAPNFADLDDLGEKILRFVAEWNDIAHPFKWSAASFNKILAKIDDNLAASKAAA